MWFDEDSEAEGNQDGSIILFPNMSFWAPLNDAGSGAVNTTLARGVGSPTFTRATTATTIGSTGLVIKGIASGTARSRYDPTTLAYQGYFSEGSRTNICLQSEDLSTTWSNTRSSESVNATTAPDGTNTADKLVEDNTAANNHFVSQAITYTNAVHSYSVWLKAGERTWARLDMFDGTTTVSVYFNLSTGAVGTASSGSGATTQYPNGWWRCMVTSSAAMAAAVGGVRILLAEADNDTTYNGDGTSGIYVWGAQLEVGSFHSSYIPTTTASVTRNADVLSYPDTGNLDWSQGWSYAEIATPSTIVAGTIIGFSSGITGNFRASDDENVVLQDGTNTASKTGLLSSATGIRKRAGAWGGSSMSVTGDGATVATANFDGTIGNFNAIGIGMDANGGNELWGTVKNGRIGMSKSSDLGLQVMTR